MRTCPHRGAVIAGDGRSVGRPRLHSVEDLADCLGSHVLTSGEFQRRAAETLDNVAGDVLPGACRRAPWMAVPATCQRWEMGTSITISKWCRGVRHLTGFGRRAG